ncbi:MAG: His-Xaa-Ser system radical SAM maturase HxsB [Phycisphaerae bacterium]|nr:His-Xaa-Ser system radical SAM maturase HxsB [Phycisphaerae bacterium]MDD5380567.1 His-Xaa-Ser system radical SAM maturase HxsB [Phycisphaerae bacterium]
MPSLEKLLTDHRTKFCDNYSLLPFRFSHIAPEKYFLSNFAGEYFVVNRQELEALIKHNLSYDSELYNSLKSRHFLLDRDSTVSVDMLSTKYRTKMSFLRQFTSLFMFVTTRRCDHSCIYCQVSHRSKSDEGFDMTEEIADKAIDFMFKSPSPAIKVEFQGGESLLHFDVVKYIIERTTHKNLSEKRDVQFVITTNLSNMTREILQFCMEHQVYISTSLDGHKELHNHNRPRYGGDSYNETIEGIAMVKEFLGSDKLSALMTTTKMSLKYPTEIVDEYIRQGLSSIFLRVINPYGFASSEDNDFSYDITEWIQFYKSVLAYILELNYSGINFREDFSSLILRKMLTPFPTGFVDLQSPAGIGISGIVFNYDGRVFPSDEARMLSAMGDDFFCIGNLLQHSFKEIMLSDFLLDTINTTMTEGMPECYECGFQPYCGSDPVRHYRMQGDIIGYKPTSDFCRKNYEVIRHLILLLEDNKKAAKVLRYWA